MKTYKSKQRLPVEFDKLSVESQRSWTIPDFYEDEWFNCIDCGTKTCFSAEKQKEWYEVDKRYFFQHPVRCRTCHDLWREKRNTKLIMDKKLLQLKSNPGNQKLMKECAFAIIDFHKKNHRGNLNLALHLLKSLNTKNADISDGKEYCKKMG